MHRVCMLVINSVFRDARVLKEAASLAKLSYNVTILGVADHNYKEGSYVLDENIRLELIKLPNLQLYKWYYILLSLSFLLLTAIPLVFTYGDMGEKLTIYYTFFIIFIASLFLFQCIFLLTYLFLRQKTEGDVVFFSHFKVLLRNYLNEIYIKRNLKKIDFEILHCHDLIPLKIGAKAFGSKKIIWDAHEIYEETPNITESKREYYCGIIKKFSSRVDKFITINDSIANFYQKKYKELPEAEIIKNAAILRKNIVYDRRLHKKLNLPVNQKILLYQGGFAEYRGLRKLVGASAHLKESWTLVMMGWGDNASELENIAKPIIARSSLSRVSPPIIFIPPVPQNELNEWCAGGTVGVIPYENIGLNHLYCTPNKLWEYPSAGVPILCSSLVEMVKVIEKNKIGWLLPDNFKSEDIANIVNNLTDEEIKSAQNACIDYIEADNWSLYEKRLFSIYRRLG